MKNGRVRGVYVLGFYLVIKRATAKTNGATLVIANRENHSVTQ